jgi:hypothetical protein
MKLTLWMLVIAACALAQAPKEPKQPAVLEKRTQDANHDAIAKKVDETIESGRVAAIGESSSERLAPVVLIAPGSPPILAFRYFDGQARHRFGDLDLVMDDAGH